MTQAKIGDKVCVEYVGMLEDGTVFDSSEKYEDPLEFTIGEGQLIKGFENAIIGMEIGQEKEIKLEPFEAYGQYNPEYVKKMPKDMFPENEEINAGMVYFLNLPDGRQYPVRVSEVEEETITIDLNPPLAGKTLVFKIKLLKINE
jgi:FKBP-type peptidyl-prolyl cis-trans isomerase 2